VDYYVTGYTERVPVVSAGIAGALRQRGRRELGGPPHAVDTRELKVTVCGEPVPRGGLRRELAWTRYDLDACTTCWGVVTAEPGRPPLGRPARS
jgi:hypothetical protein